MEGLKQSTQTGAWNILLNGPVGLSPTSPPGAMEIKQILKGQVNSTRAKKPFCKVFPDISIDDITESLKSDELNREFHFILANGSCTLTLHDGIPQQSPQYISRCLSNKVFLDPAVFKLDIQDVFVYKGISSEEVNNLVKPSISQGSMVQRCFITCRHILLEDDEDWDDMALVCVSPMHLVSKEGDDYVMIRSTKLPQHLLTRVGNKDSRRYISEDQFVEQFVSNTENKVAILCDLPGAGKTFLMENLAAKISGRDGANYAAIFYIQMESLNKFFEGQLAATTKEMALSSLLGVGCRSKLTGSLLYKQNQKHQNTFLFILDGFEDIRDSFIERTLAFLDILNSNSTVQLIISSRPGNRVCLEKTFNIVSYELLPFNKDEQVSAIVGQWHQNILNQHTPVLEHFASRCISAVNTICKQTGSHGLGMPLKCLLLSVITTKFAQQLAVTGRKRPLQIPDEAIIDHLSSNFSKFLDYHDGKMEVFEKMVAIYTRANYSTSVFADVLEYISSLSSCEKKNMLLLREFATKQNLSLRFFPRCAKQMLLRIALDENREDDAKVIDLLMLLFGNKEGDYLKIVSGGTNASGGAGLEVDKNKAEGILSCLELSEANETFTGLNLTSRYALSNLEKLETLRMLIGIAPDFAKCNNRKWSYTHYAVWDGKVDWLEFMIKTGNDLNQRDIVGCTPLLYMIPKNALEMTRLLVDNGVDIYAVDNGGRNVSSRLAWWCIFWKLELPHEWISYTIQNGHGQLWTTEDREGIQTVQWLPEIVGENNPVVVMLKSRLNIKNVERLDILHVFGKCINECSDDQLVKVLLRLFGKRADEAVLQHILDSESTVVPAEANEIAKQLLAEDVLNWIDVDRARNELAGLQMWYANYNFKFLEKVETLKILMGILPDFSHFNKNNWNYLHSAAFWNKMAWAEYLVKSGADVNQHADIGKSPLVCIYKPNSIDIARLLIDNGADVNAVDTSRKNVAHIILLGCTPDVAVDLATYMLQKGINEIWKVHDWMETTAFELLEYRLGKDHPVLKQVKDNLSHPTREHLE